MALNAKLWPRYRNFFRLVAELSVDQEDVQTFGTVFFFAGLARQPASDSADVAWNQSPLPTDVDRSLVGVAVCIYHVAELQRQSVK